MLKVTAILKDGKKKLVERDELQYLLATDKVTKFMRSDGWVVVGSDCLRECCDYEFSGEERRQQQIYASGY